MTEPPHVCWTCLYWMDQVHLCLLSLGEFKPVEPEDTCENWALDPSLERFLRDSPIEWVIHWAQACKVYPREEGWPG